MAFATFWHGGFAHLASPQLVSCTLSCGDMPRLGSAKSGSEWLSLPPSNQKASEANVSLKKCVKIVCRKVGVSCYSTTGLPQLPWRGAATRPWGAAVGGGSSSWHAPSALGHHLSAAGLLQVLFRNRNGMKLPLTLPASPNSCGEQLCNACTVSSLAGGVAWLCFGKVQRCCLHPAELLRALP